MTETHAVPAVTMTMMPGTWRPTEAQELVLDAALADPVRAEAAFEQWVTLTGFDEVDAGSYRLLPLVSARFEQLGITGPWSAHLRGILRRSWYENQLMLRGTLPAVDLLQAAGIDVIVLKGGAVSVLAYPSVGARPMDDLDVFVPEAQAADALELLLDAGWQLGTEGVPTAMRRGEVPASFRRLRHSTGLTGPDGFDIDLHWHATYAWCWPGADRDLWADARPLELGGRSLLALSAPDELIVACVHGCLANLIAPIRWVSDSVLVMRSVAMSWDTLVRRARDLLVEPHLARALGYLRTRFDAPVPEWVFAALGQRRPGYFERQWLVSRMDLRETRTLAAHYGAYLRGARAETGFQRYVGGVPNHLVYQLGCDSTSELSGELARRAAARLRRVARA